ncbi:MAG: hypothetical protein ACLRJV_19870 [Eubacteriales bacterium]
MTSPAFAPSILKRPASCLRHGAGHHIGQNFPGRSHLLPLRQEGLCREKLLYGSLPALWSHFGILVVFAAGTIQPDALASGLPQGP